MRALEGDTYSQQQILPFEKLSPKRRSWPHLLHVSAKIRSPSHNVPQPPAYVRQFLKTPGHNHFARASFPQERLQPNLKTIGTSSRQEVADALIVQNQIVALKIVLQATSSLAKNEDGASADAGEWRQVGGRGRTS